MKKIKRSDALMMLSIMFAYSEKTTARDLCFLGLQKEKILSSKIEKRHAQTKVKSFFEKIPKDFSKKFQEENSERYTVLKLILFISDYLSKFRTEKVFNFKEISAKINKEIEDANKEVDESKILIGLLNIKD